MNKKNLVNQIVKALMIVVSELVKSGVITIIGDNTPKVAEQEVIQLPPPDTRTTKISTDKLVKQTIKNKRAGAFGKLLPDIGPDYTTSGGVTIVNLCILFGWQLGMRMALSVGADPNKPCADGMLPLTLCLLSNKYALSEKLIRAGADPTRECPPFASPYSIADTIGLHDGKPTKTHKEKSRDTTRFKKLFTKQMLKAQKEDK